MGSMTEDISQIRIPPADETLPKTFADLEAKLSHWKAAMLAAQEQLVDQARMQAELQQQLESRSQEQAQLKSQLDAQAEAQATAAEQLRQQADAQAGHEQQADAGPRTPPESLETADGEVAAGSPPDWSSADISKHIKVYGDYAKRPPEPEPKAASADASEDEALLASLDPETAKAIRVMRRMSGGRKSVRELLEQYHTGQSTPRNEPTKKSWFRRG